MKSPKETALEEKILRQLAGYAFPEALARVLFSDEETQHIQEYANVVSLRRLGFNDHGPVHMRQVAYNAIKALVILHGAGVKTTPFSASGSCRAKRSRCGSTSRWMLTSDSSRSRKY